VRWIAEARERLGALIWRGRADAETLEEMRVHVEMEAERLMRDEGLTVTAAHRQATIAFGGIERHRDAVRDARGFGALNGVSLDVRLGSRMLVKYPGLTLAGGLALAIALALAASLFEFFNDMATPPVGLPDGNRVVVVEMMDRENAREERRTLADFELWRQEASTIRDLTAINTTELTVTTDAGGFTSLRAGRITGAAVTLGRFEPIIGRAFDEADATEGAQLPVLIGHEVWRDLFDGDRSVVGRTLQLGDQPGVVVGVMPEGFGFPLNQQIWLPLRERGNGLERRAGPSLLIMGRLAPGIRLSQAQAELATIGDRVAAAHPDTHEHLRPRVLTASESMGMGALVRLMNVPFILFLLVVSANVATLVFARTASRMSEIAVRSALGATRRRLVLQLVAESLVLTSLATAVGLAIAQWGLHHGMTLFWEVQQMAPPYFFDTRLSPITIIYTILLGVVAAIVIGGIPALKATGRQLRSQLAQPGAGGNGLRFGRLSTVVIVVQVAICVAFLPPAIMTGRELLPERRTAMNFPADEYLTALVTVQPGNGVRVGALFNEVKQRLAVEPGIEVVALTGRMPGFNHPVERFEIEGVAVPSASARSVVVDRDYFDAIDARVIAGRTFVPGDLNAGTSAVLVDAAWAERELGGRNPVGLRIRISTQSGEDGQWQEIVGVVDGTARAVGPGSSVAFYRPLRVGMDETLRLYLRTNASPATLMRSVHNAVTSVDPALAVHELAPLDQVWAPVLKSDLYFLAGLHVVAAIILLFALVGIYALLSFTVSQRSREIAVRAALGANPRSIVVAVFSRAVRQIALGVVIGAVLVSAAVARSPESLALVAGIAVLMMVVGLAGCAVPAFRAVRIHPTEALKAE
jgi:putative ABC transport system permease protein